ncbi:MAG: hypothetical protein MZU95_17190 [Desulfomicrobium escambiense]|nr:hypothetical protein [Desulfomicrobium escambiense]
MMVMMIVRTAGAAAGTRPRHYDAVRDGDADSARRRRADERLPGACRT